MIGDYYKLQNNLFNIILSVKHSIDKSSELIHWIRWRGRVLSVLVVQNYRYVAETCSREYNWCRQE